jgi:hypothetical protein
MITTGEAWRGERVLRVAFVVSIVVHLLLGLLAFHAFDGLAKLARVAEKPKDQEIVAVSSAIRLERRPKPVPVARTGRPGTVNRPRPHPQPPAPAYFAQLPLPEAPQPLRRESQPKHELTKSVPTPLPRPPTSAPTTAAEKRLALVQRPEAVTHAPHEPAHPERFSDEQVAQIQHDLEQTIAQARAANDPLRAVPKATPAAPKRYRVQMEGQFGELRRGEGYYYPIKGWTAGGWDYYYVSYDFTWADGTYESGSVPWPIHFSPARDPFTHPEIGALHDTPLPPPPPGYVPPPDLGKALCSFFPGYAFNNNG